MRRTVSWSNLFRYIEQAFVIPAEDESIDIGSESDFQQGLRDLLADGAEPGVIRERASEFLDGILADPDRLPRMPRYQKLRTDLRAMKTPQASDVKDLVLTVVNEPPDALVQSSEFAEEKRVLDDALVAIKMTTGFDRAACSAPRGCPPRRPERPRRGARMRRSPRSPIPGRRIASLTSRWSIDTFPRAEKNDRYPHNQEGRVFQAAMAERGLKVRGPRSA